MTITDKAKKKHHFLERRKGNFYPSERKLGIFADNPMNSILYNKNQKRSLLFLWRIPLFTSVIFVACLLFALLAAPRAAATAIVDESPYQPALDRLVQWGVMHGYEDGQLHPERYLTRAQFVAMVNRAYGYKELGTSNPFRDVDVNAWYSDDVSIAYRAGYFTGTTNSTASPDALLSRQQAMTLLAKNMRLESVPGEVTEFTDGSRFATYSKGYVKTAVQQDLIGGYPDGSFRPEDYITRGAMAVLLYRCLGNLIHEPGTYELGDTFGNLTINSSATTLRNTTVSGNLYISGGLGLGGVTLENVRVLGNIVVAGTGESEGGDESVILRNVDADKLQIDTISGQYLALRAEGTTSIKDTVARSDAFIQDRTPVGAGLLNISLEGNSGDRFTLTGNVENVANRTLNSVITVAEGTVQNLTMDETGTGGSLNVSVNGTVKNLNLDTATTVTGTGDVENLIVNTTGSRAAMLPDNVVIRPGITSTVSGKTMDTTIGQESSSDPHLLASYPKVTDIAPTTATALFSTNKAGRVYWAISGIADGSITEEELLNPSAYGSRALQSGNLQVATSNTEVKATIRGLASGGSYYLSAIMTDDRGTRSTVKVYSFSTPDNTVPAFTSGYPNVSRNSYDTNTSGANSYHAQIMVMANKSCMLYWALYNRGSATPTPAEFRSGSLSGSIANGTQELTRSFPSFVDLPGLSELTSYDIYFWLTDADFARSSTVRKLNFTTVDGTPPVFLTGLTVRTIRSTGMTLTCNLNENGTVYWVVVPTGTDYPKPPAGSNTVTPDYGRLQIASGMNGLRSGSVNVRANTDATINISGLQAQTTYDIWYIARDTAGNYSNYPAGDLNNPDDPSNPRRVCMITANTLDNAPPTVTQEFTRHPEGNDNSPYSNTDVHLIFNENVQRYSTGERLYNLYQAIANADNNLERSAAISTMATALSATIHLYEVSTGLPTLVTERNSETEDSGQSWVIDYRNARMELEDGQLIVIFPSVSEAEGETTSALHLQSGATYYFEVEDIADTSSARNRMAITRLSRFRTIAAQVLLQNLSLPAAQYPSGVEDVDMAFTFTPVSTSQSDPSTTWDMLLWSDMSVEYEVYVRSRLSDSTEYDDPWRKVPYSATVAIPSTAENSLVGQSLHFNLYRYGVGETPNLSTLDDNRIYEYAIRFLAVNGDSERNGWSQEVHFYISVITGSSAELGNLSANISTGRFEAAKEEYTIIEISLPSDLEFRLTKTFLDTAPPTFSSGRPLFSAEDTSVEMRLQLNRMGTIYYVVAPADGTISTRRVDGTAVEWNIDRDLIPTTGSDILLDVAGNAIRDENGNDIPLAPFYLSAPSYLEIVNPMFDNPEIKYGSIPITSGSVTATVAGLIPETNYFVYFVLKGRGQTYSQYAQLFRFTTTEINRPVLTLDLANPIVNVSSNREASVDYMVVNYNSSALSTLLSRPFWNNDPSGRMDVPSNYPGYALVTNVLQAMATNVASSDNEGKGSIFDIYATQTYKDQLADYIRASSSNTAGTIIGVGHGVEVTPGQRFTVDCSTFPMSERTQYAFLAVGRNPSGSGDAFRAIYPLTLVDTDPPQITAIQSTLRMDEVSGGESNTCSGRVSLTFTEYLYHSDNRTDPPTLRQVDRGPVASTRRTNDYISIGSLVQSRSSNQVSLMDTEESLVNQHTLTIELQFTNAIDGDFITFNSDLCDQFSNIRSAPLSVAVRITRVRTQVDVDENGNPVYRYIPTPMIDITDDWDARTSR